MQSLHDLIARIRSRVPLTDVMAAYSAQAADGTWPCPLHPEPASLRIEGDQWVCPACGKGDVIDLVAKAEGCTREDAAAQLAGQYGVAVSAAERPAVAEGRVRAALAFAAEFFAAQLHTEAGRAGLTYLRGRGFTDQTLATFGAGWASGGGALVTAARREGFLPAELLAAGLVRDQEGRLREVFFGRVILPVRDRAGRTVAFTARLLPVDEARLKAEGKSVGKWINSSAEVYAKGSALFGLPEAAEAAEAEKRIVVVEGGADVLAAHQAGVRAVVAPCGTALTVDQLSSLWPLLPDDGRLVLAFDADKPGQDATVKAIRAVWATGRSCWVVRPTPGKDVAELLQTGAAKSWLEAVQSPLRDIDAAGRLLLPVVPENPLDALEAVGPLLELVAAMADHQRRDLLLERVAEVTRLHAPALRKRIKGQPMPVPAAAGNGGAGPLTVEVGTVMDHGLHQRVVATLERFLSEQGVIPDAVGGWMREGSDRRVVVKSRELINRFLFRYSSQFEVLSKDRVAWTLDAIVYDRRASRRREIIGRLIGRPSTDAGRAAARAWVRATTGGEDPVDVAVLLHFLWQVKRRAADMPVDHDLMPVLFGQVQGSGKTRAIRRLCEPFAELVVPVNAEKLTDDRSAEMKADYLIGVWDELSGGNKADAAALKHILTADIMAYRELATHNHNVIPKRITLIASSNDPVDAIITDSTGARRYYQWKALELCDWEAVNSLDPALIWEAVSEDEEAPFKAVAAQVKEHQADLVYQDPIDLWLQEETWGELRLVVTDQTCSESLGVATRVITAYSHAQGERFENIAGRYTHWCRKVGNPAMAANKLGARLKSLGFRRERPRTPTGTVRPLVYFLPERIPEAWAASLQDHLRPRKPASERSREPVPEEDQFDRSSTVTDFDHV